MKSYKVAIVGGGASGLMSAALLAEKNIDTILIEKNHKLGRKLYSTGSGKGNYLNENISADFYIGDKAEISKIIKEEYNSQLKDFFSMRLGILPVKDERGRIFPFSMKAESIVYAFESFIKNKSVSVKLLTEAQAIEKKGNFEIKVKRKIPQSDNKFKFEEETIKSENLILAAGGPSYPRIGGSDSGFKLLSSLGHSVKEIKPIITPFSVSNPRLPTLDGVRIDAKVTIEKGKERIELMDELLFTQYGISGPLALEISFYFKGDKIDIINLDLMPNFSIENIMDFVNKRIEMNLSYEELLLPFLDKKIVNFILSMLKIEIKEKVNLDNARKFFMKLKKFELYDLKPLGFEYAMSKTGGAPLSEIDENFESKIMKNLFLTGEILDCGGKSGGYNLYFAWLSGFLSANKIIKNSILH